MCGGVCTCVVAGARVVVCYHVWWCVHVCGGGCMCVAVGARVSSRVPGDAVVTVVLLDLPGLWMSISKCRVRSTAYTGNIS